MPRGRKKKIDTVELSSLAENKIVDVNTKKLLQENYYIYNSYISSGRTCVSVMDGLKSIYRRIIYTAFKICRHDLIKSASLSGTVMATLSPHGDCYGSIVGLVNDGVLFGKGNWGSKIGVTSIGPAASRYTEVKLNPISEKLFINSEFLPYVDWKMSDLGKQEPVFLPTLLPVVFTALGDNAELEIGMSKGIKNVYPKFTAESLLNYAINYLKTGRFDDSLLVFKFMNLTKNFNTSTKNYNGNSHDFTESFNILYDEKDDGVHLTSVLPDFNLESVLEGIPYKDFSKTNTDILIPTKFFNASKFISKVHFMSYAYSGTDSHVTIHPYSVQIAIRRCIENFRQIIIPRYYQSEINKITTKINELETLLYISKLLSKNKDFLDVYNNKLTQTEKEIADKYTIASLMKVNQETINTLKDELQKIINASKKPDQLIMNLYKDALKCLQ